MRLVSGVHCTNYMLEIAEISDIKQRTTTYATTGTLSLDFLHIFS